tara:strand:- start:253 stop:666 length:414 start_codon:yes stop_codon:yes gene_type:complete
MKKLLMSITLCLCILGLNAQDKSDIYIGAGDIANKAWTEWSVSPTIGYGITDNLMVGLNVSQVDSTVDISYDLHARYYMNGYFIYVATSGLDTENMSYGVGKMFTFHKGVYIDPKIVYDATAKTTNLMLGVGLRFCK